MGKITLKCIGAGKSYNNGALSVQVLNHLDFEVTEAGSASIIGSSGSGRSTLLYLLDGLDIPSKGKVILMDQDLGSLSQKQLGESHNRYLGFVYQLHHLLPEFSALENVMIPLLIDRMPRVMAREKAIKMPKKVGLDERMLYHLGELSGSERQYAAIACALVNEPECLSVDEPAGNLDRKNAQNVLDMILDLERELNTSLIVMAHGDELAEHLDRVMTMRDGSLQVLQ